MQLVFGQLYFEEHAICVPKSLLHCAGVYLLQTKSWRNLIFKPIRQSKKSPRHRTFEAPNRAGPRPLRISSSCSIPV